MLRKDLTSQHNYLKSDGRNMPPYSSSIKPHYMISGYLVCRKKCEQPLPVVPLVNVIIPASLTLIDIMLYIHMKYKNAK